MTLDGDDGGDVYLVSLGSLVGALTVGDTGGAGADVGSLSGNAVGDNFVVTDAQTTLGTQVVNYNGNLEQLVLLGEGGDDVFSVSPSTSTTMTVNGGTEGIVDALTVDAQGQAAVDSGTDVTVPGFQPINYVDVESVNIINNAGGGGVASAASAPSPETEWKIRIADILDAISRIDRYTHGLGFEDFISNEEKVDAVMRNLITIGESAVRIPDEVKSECSEVEWK